MSQDIGREIIESGSFDNYKLDTIITVLRLADDLYYNDDESFLTDPEYDSLRRYAHQSCPTHSYFIGIGSSVRGGKIKLPFEMGSLDQVEVGEIVGWVEKWGLKDHFIIATDKLDGASEMVIYDDDGNIQIAYSRGDGVEGADVTRHISKIKNVPKNVGKRMTVRGEVILPKVAFDVLRTKVMSRSGKPYKNPRNMASGLMNAEVNDPIVYKYLDFVAYEILGDEHSKTEMLSDLRDLGFLIPHATAFYGHELSDSSLADYLDERRLRNVYEIDGLVLDVNAAMVRKSMNPTRDTLNPAYAIKYKVADASNYAETEVVRVEWNPSKHGYLKPRVELKPVELVGVTVTFATGYNAKYIVDNNIGPGSIVAISRMGDVVPNIIKTIKGTSASLPDVDFSWIKNDDDSEVDIQLDNHLDNPTVIINQLTDFFTKIDAPHLKKGSVTKLYNAGHTTPEEIINLTEGEFVRIIGENGRKIYKGLREKLSEIPLYKLLGAFSNERGIGIRRIRKLQMALGGKTLRLTTSPHKIAAVDKFDFKTAAQVVKVLEAFRIFWPKVCQVVTIAKDDGAAGGKLNGQKIVFTGFRDKDLQAEVESQGGEMQSALSGKTTILVAKNPNSSSGKMKKAKDLGTRIMGIDDFRGMLQ